MLVLGIDNGTTGAASVLDVAPSRPPRLVDILDLPLHGDKSRRRIDAMKFIAFLESHDIRRAHIERGQGRAPASITNVLSYGKLIGGAEALVEGCGIAVYVIDPVVWKRHHGLLKTEKEASRAKALELFGPSETATALLARKMDHNRAESALIALAGESKLGVLYTSGRKDHAGAAIHSGAV